MSHHVIVAAFTALAGTLYHGHGPSGANAAITTGSLWWLGSVSLAAVVAMVLLELGKSLPRDHFVRRLADRATWPLVALAITVILLSGFRLAEIIGFVQ